MAVWKLKPSEPRQVVRLDYELPKDQQFSDLNCPALAVSPDGKRIIFSSFRDGKLSLYWKAADGTGEVEQLASAPGRMLLSYSWSSDGKILVAVETVEMKNWDIGMLSMEGDHARKPLLQQGIQPKIPPDGRWMAYTSAESTHSEVFVRPFPEVNSGTWQVSTSGGGSPLWSPSGRELFYLGNDGSVMAVAVETKPTFSLGIPKTLFRHTNVGGSLGGGTPWGISPDGKRFLMMKEAGSTASETPRRINIVLNWLEELKQRMPVK